MGGGGGFGLHKVRGILVYVCGQKVLHGGRIEHDDDRLEARLRPQLRAGFEK